MMKNAIRKPLSWTPVRRGAIYCSPACGVRCTHEAFTSANVSARKLCRQLGRGWKPHVWENMGWYWEVGNGVATIRLNPDGRYRASAYEGYYAAGNTPVLALQALERNVRCDWKKMDKLMDAVVDTMIKAIDHNNRGTP